MLNLLLLTFSTDAKHFLFWRWPGSGKAQNWILFKSIFESLYGLLFVVTRSSCAPSTLFGLCFCVFGGSAKGGLTFFVCGRVGGRMAGWPDGRMAGWPGGRVAGWPESLHPRVAGWPGGRMAGWPDGRVAGFRQSLITAIFQQSFAQSFKTGIMSAMFPRGFRKVSARFGCWNVQFASMLSSYFAKNFPIRKTRRGPNREVAGNFAEDFKAQRYAPSGLPMVFPTTYPAKAICLAKEVKMSLRTKLP